jgi:SAM-dependent methyltransferase
MCILIAERSFADREAARIIDVGSATGFTLMKLREAGFKTVNGVDSSLAMLDKSRIKENLIHSDVFPKSKGKYDLVLANWTLHFVKDRKAYLQDIHDSLSEDGMFILSEKMSSSKFVHDRYHDFKRSMGVSDKEIEEKERSLRDVLIPYPLGWYLENLSAIGFIEIEIIDAAWCFKTLLCRKR